MIVLFTGGIILANGIIRINLSHGSINIVFRTQTVRETFIYFSIQYLIYFLLIINFHPLRNDKKNDNDELV